MKSIKLSAAIQLTGVMRFRDLLNSRELARRLGIDHAELIYVIERNRQELLEYGVVVETPGDQEA